MNYDVITKEDKNDLISFSSEQVGIIKRDFAKGLSDAEFVAYMMLSKKRGLDPLQRQIYAIPRKDGRGQRMVTYQTSIDGARLIAHRTGEYAGRDKAVFDYDNNRKPVACEVTVYRLVQGNRVPFTASARWSEYYPGDKQGFMWRKMPETMIEKCAEMKALRMAFPGDLGGLYVEEEMHQSESDSKGQSTKFKEVTSELISENEEGPAKNEAPNELVCPGPSSYLIPFGKLKGKAIGELTEEELASLHGWLKKSESEGKIRGQAVECKQKLDDYLDGRVDNGN